ncbi:MAG TPA: type II toxin-antitoxin system MqsR family toxin [Polyangiaceae bacterium]|nr:type II toxin-antitoxin system MqsR family toxin [Polyangiaceae bacterium]
MPSWIPRTLERIRKLAVAGSVRITHKALCELASLELGIDQEDVLLLLQRLEASDCAGRLRSSLTNEWLYVFKPKIAATVLYLKVAIRQDCIVVSLHEDEENSNE